MEFIVKVKFEGKDTIVSFDDQLRSTNPNFIPWINNIIKRHLPVETVQPDAVDFNQDDYTAVNYYYAIDTLFDEVGILEPLIEEDTTGYIF